MTKENYNDAIDERAKDYNKKICDLIGPLLWQTDAEENYIIQKPHLKIDSDMAGEVQSLFISEYPDTDKISDKNIYKKNYLFFRECWKNVQQADWKKIIVIIKQRCILIPFICDTQESALTIFSTLNDRGMQLTDADLFKADLYGMCKTNSEKKTFIDNWNQLLEHLRDNDTEKMISCSEIFRHYYHFLRAQENCDHEKEISLRKFYRDKSTKKLSPEMLSSLNSLVDFWHDIYIGMTEEATLDNCYLDIGENENFANVLKCVQILSRMQSDTWKIALSVFYLSNLKSPNLWERMSCFAKNLTAYICFYSIKDGTSSDNQKKIVYQLNDDMLKQSFKCDEYFKFSAAACDFEKFKLVILDNHTSKLSDCLVTLLTYMNPKQDFWKKIEIEHIRPQSWRKEDPEDERDFIDYLGNKLPLDKKTNIKVKDNWLNRKAKIYQQSPILLAQEFASKYGSLGEWHAQDIRQRENDIINQLWKYFTGWNSNN